jgi:hypothetical protein
MGYRRQPETRIQLRDGEAVLVVAGILTEAGKGDVWYSPGGNEVVVPEDALAALNDEQRAEVAKLSDGPLSFPGSAASPDSDAGDEPPRSGAGSGREAWAAYAASKGINVPKDAGRDQIIELVEAQR